MIMAKSMKKLTKTTTKKALKKSAKKATKNILVIGDWFVDENWIVTLEKSETSSHIGKQLYRSRVGDNNAQLLSLCGAGGVARLLHGL